MEDYDEFGDLYTDVLRPLQSSSFIHTPSPVQFKQPSPNRPIDPNIQSDDGEIISAASNHNPNPKINFITSHLNQIPSFNCEKEDLADGVSSSAIGFSPQPRVSAVLESGRHLEDPSSIDESVVDVVVEESDEKGDLLVQKDVKKETFGKFGIEDTDDTRIGNMGSCPLIPGIKGGSIGLENHGNDASGEGDEWDSDSEDDLQIVLNDNNYGGIVMDGNAVMGSDDEDENGDPLVIVDDSEPGHQRMEELEWGKDATRTMDGESKELGGDAAKMDGGTSVVPKIGYNNHVYHPYYSQFKYVRPGAAPIPGSTSLPGGALAQVRPTVNVGLVAGRGRGDWRPFQRSFQPGFGPVWEKHTVGRGFGSGLDFTLPSHKTIFEVDVDSFEEKSWRLPGIDVSDFFNFSLNEESWKDYCKQLEQLRLQTTMQSKIRVYESGRTKQEYDPDLPPELSSVAGIHDISSGNANLGMMDAGQSDISKATARPTGRAIQVETNYSERLPSIDTRPPRFRDSDAIIEIVLKDSADETEQMENNPSREAFTEGIEIEKEDEKEDVMHLSHAYDVKNWEHVGGTSLVMKSVQNNVAPGHGSLSLSPESQVQYSSDSRGKSSAYPGRDFGILHGERQTNGRALDRSPSITQYDNQKEDSVKSVSGKSSGEELDVGRGDGLNDETVVVLLDTIVNNDQEDTNPLPLVKKQKLRSRVEQSSLQEMDNEEDIKAARSSENRKPRRLMHDNVEKEVDLNEHSICMGNWKRSDGEGEQGVIRGKGRDARREMKKHGSVDKVREEDSYSRRDWDPYPAHHLQGKDEDGDMRKERENLDGAWYWKDVDKHIRRTRAEDTNKRVCGDEIGSRNRNKRDEDLRLKKQLENGNVRDRYDKDVVASRRREGGDNFESRYEDMDHNLHRKEEKHLRRGDGGKKEILYRRHRENSSNRPKREREDSLDQHNSKRENQMRMRDDADSNFVRHKEEGWIHRERSERHRERDELKKTKQSHESLSKQEREDRWGGGVRVKDGYKDFDGDYQFKDKRRHSGLSERRRDEVDTNSEMMSEDVHASRNQLSNDDRRPRQERASARGDRVVSGYYDNDRAHEKKHKNTTRKSRESESGYQNSMGISKRIQVNESGQGKDPVILKGATERGTHKHENLLPNRHSSRTHKEDACSEDEQQGSKRGRSKLERWTSHKEKDFNIPTDKPSSFKVKEIDRDNNGGLSLARKKLPDETLTNKADEKDDVNTGIENVDPDKHFDTVAKLKKRSERFKLPMPSEKEAIVIKKMESQPLPCAQSELRGDSEIKLERPARKRRWISS